MKNTLITRLNQGTSVYQEGIPLYHKSGDEALDPATLLSSPTSMILRLPLRRHGRPLCLLGKTGDGVGRNVRFHGWMVVIFHLLKPPGKIT